jgi:two-component system, NtrC family, sensor histidine kinase HydH
VEGAVLLLENEALRVGRSVSRTDYTAGDALSVPALALFSAPIVAKDRILGTITLCRQREQKDAAEDQEDQHLLGTIANYVSSGLENALLNIKLRDALRELGDAQRRLIEHEKLRSLGEMTANIAHEIKNPLVVIGGFTKRLAKTAHLDESESRYVDIITKEVARLESILTEILSYVKETPLRFELCDVNSLMDELLYLLGSDKAWDNIEIVREYDKDKPYALCDVQQIKQVLLNILVNAFEAMSGKGSITIKTESTLVQGKPFLAVSLTDTGGGVDPSSLDNIFNPFFTTKESGSGLGLAVTNKIIVAHGGNIEVKNKPGEGVTFIVYLPGNSIKREG